MLVTYVTRTGCDLVELKLRSGGTVLKEWQVVRITGAPAEEGWWGDNWRAFRPQGSSHRKKLWFLALHVVPKGIVTLVGHVLATLRQ